MNTIILTWRKPSDEMNFRNEVVTITKEWEMNYNVNLKDLGDDVWSLIFKHKEKYENRSTLLLDADKLASYFEQWTEFRVTTLQVAVNGIVKALIDKGFKVIITKVKEKPC